MKLEWHGKGSRKMKASEKVATCVQSFLKDESGLSAVEYGLLAAGIAMGLWTLIHGIGSDLSSIFTNVKTDLDTAAS